MAAQGIDHVELYTDDKQSAIDYFTRALGFAQVARSDDHGKHSVLVRSPSGGITCTLLEPDNTRSPGQLDAFLKRNDGPGVQHLAFGVTDIVAAVSQIKPRGVEFLGTPTRTTTCWPSRCQKSARTSPGSARRPSCSTGTNGDTCCSSCTPAPTLSCTAGSSAASSDTLYI
jgi:4-hydroxyphenylpyruvate dioxygenase-like putative hemolysin